LENDGVNYVGEKGKGSRPPGIEECKLPLVRAL